MFYSHFRNQRHFDHSHNNYCKLSKSYYLFYFRKCFHCCFIKFVQIFSIFWRKIWESGQYHWIILMFFIRNNFVHSKFSFFIKKWYGNDIHVSSFHNKKLLSNNRKFLYLHNKGNYDKFSLYHICTYILKKNKSGCVWSIFKKNMI